MLAGLAGLHAPLLAQACSPQLGASASSDAAGVEGLQWLAAAVQPVPPLVGCAAEPPPKAPPTQVMTTVITGLFASQCRVSTMRVQT